MHITLHATSRYEGGILIERIRLLGIAKVAMHKNNSFVLGASCRRDPVPHAITRAIDSHPGRSPQTFALRFSDRDAPGQQIRWVERRIIGIRRRLWRLVLKLRDNGVVRD